MPETDHAAVQDDPLSAVIAAVGSVLDDCEHTLTTSRGEAGEALEFTRFLRAELPRLLEDWQMRRRDHPASDMVVARPADERPMLARRPATLRGHAAAVKDVAFSPDGATLASADEHGLVRLWDARTGHRTGTLNDRSGMAILSVAFSPDATTLATATPAGTLWDLTSATIATTLHTQTPSDRVWSVAYSLTNDLVATGNSHDAVCLWNPRTGQMIRTLTHPGTVFAVALSSDGITLASGGTHSNVLVWDTRTGQRRHVLTGHAGTIHALAFSPDDQILASASYDRTIRLWDMRTGRPVATLTGHTSSVMTVAFHPAGTILASGGAGASIDYPEDDHTVRLWNIHTLRPITTLTGHRGTVSRVAFHPDGAHLASGSFDTTVRLWPIGHQPDPDQPILRSTRIRRRHPFGRRRPPNTTIG